MKRISRLCRHDFVLARERRNQRSISPIFLIVNAIALAVARIVSVSRKDNRRTIEDLGRGGRNRRQRLGVFPNKIFRHRRGLCHIRLRAVCHNSRRKLGRK